MMNGTSPVQGTRASVRIEDAGRVCRRADGRDSLSAGSASPADVETLLARYLLQARAESRTARSVASVLETLRAMEQERSLSKGRRRAGKLRASSIFQGVVGLAAAALSAVGAGLGTGAAGAAQAGTAAARSREAARVAVRAASTVLSKAGPHADPFKHQAGSLGLGRDAASARAEEQAGFSRLAAEHLRAVEASRRRVVEIMDRCSASLEAAGRHALSSRV